MTPFVLFSFFRMLSVLISLALLIFLAVVGWRWIKAHESIARTLSSWTGQERNDRYRSDHG